jgi:hypothetical protein
MKRRYADTFLQDFGIIDDKPPVLAIEYEKLKMLAHIADTLEDILEELKKK